MEERSRSRLRRWLVGASLVGGGAYAFQIGAGCASFGGEQALIATDFCFIFDCNNGAFGGTIQPCAGAATIGDNGEVVNTRSPLFTDCVNLQP